VAVVSGELLEWLVVVAFVVAGVVGLVMALRTRGDD